MNSLHLVIYHIIMIVHKQQKHKTSLQNTCIVMNIVILHLKHMYMYIVNQKTTQHMTTQYV